MRDFSGGTELRFTLEDLVNHRIVVRSGITPVRSDLDVGPACIVAFGTAWGS
jgi:hypothetical protein